IATLRYQFPYMERRSRRPDPPPLCHATVRAAVATAARLAPALPLFAGGRSFGGRMTSQAQALEPLPGVRGLAFLGFPLHPAGRAPKSGARRGARWPSGSARCHEPPRPRTLRRQAHLYAHPRAARRSGAGAYRSVAVRRAETRGAAAALRLSPGTRRGVEILG